MARTRSVKIVETLEELNQLRSYYSGRPESLRLLFILFLKEKQGRTVAEAAERAGITSRRGRYWWDAYRSGGLKKLLDRRVWRVDEVIENGTTVELDENQDQPDANSALTVGKITAFVNRISSIDLQLDRPEWVAEFKSAIMELLPSIDYVAMNIAWTADPYVGGGSRRLVYRENELESGEKIVTNASSPTSRHAYDDFIEDGKRNGFPFERFHFPPHAIDLYSETGLRTNEEGQSSTYIGSILFFALRSGSNIDIAYVNAIERLRPFLCYAVLDRIIKFKHTEGNIDVLQNAFRIIGKDADLTTKEEQVLAFGLMGHSYQEIANLMHISLNTVQTHIRSIYRKTEVGKLSEVFAKYFTPRTFRSKG